MGIKLGKSYTNVYELLRGEYPEDPEFAESFRETHKREQISSILWMMRMQSGVSQAELAERMGVSQSKISKLEAHGDSVKFNEVVAYARALGYNTTLGFTDRAMNLAGLIRWHLESTTSIMRELERLSADDPDISMSAFNHFSDELNNMLGNVLPQWHEKLAKLKHECKGDPIHEQGLFITVQPAPGEQLKETAVPAL